MEDIYCWFIWKCRFCETTGSYTCIPYIKNTANQPTKQKNRGKRAEQESHGLITLTVPLGLGEGKVFFCLRFLTQAGLFVTFYLFIYFIYFFTNFSMESEIGMLLLIFMIFCLLQNIEVIYFSGHQIFNQFLLANENCMQGHYDYSVNYDTDLTENDFTACVLTIINYISWHLLVLVLFLTSLFDLRILLS